MRQVRVVYLAHRDVPSIGTPRVRVRMVRWGWACVADEVKNEVQGRDSVTMLTTRMPSSAT